MQSGEVGGVRDIVSLCVLHDIQPLLSREKLQLDLAIY